jgi:hypothetical protein
VLCGLLTMGHVVQSALDIINAIWNFLVSPTGQVVKNSLISSAIYLLVAVIGGRLLISRYIINTKKREQQIELARLIKHRQYDALEEIYKLFGKYMQLYREINCPDTNLADEVVRKALFNRCANAEGRIESVILRIGSEFPKREGANLEEILGNLRQSVKLWRECVRDQKKLPFHISSQSDYVRFKTCFAHTSSYLATAIYEATDPIGVKMEDASNLLNGAFSNKYEKHDWQQTAEPTRQRQQ